MRMRGCFKLFLVLLLVLSMALSACDGLGTDGTETDTKGNETSNEATESSSESTGGDATESSSESTAGDATESSSESTAGDATESSSESTAGDATESGSESTGGDATESGSESTGGDATESDSENSTTPPDECKHSETDLLNAKSATCASEGYSGDKVCKACGEVVENGTVIDMLTEHSWDDGAITKTPTCATTGVKTFTCDVCHITKTESVDVVECKNEYHFIADEAHALTCTVCFKTTSGEHTKSQLVLSSEATCLEGAYEIYHCADCDSDFKIYDHAKPALGHAWDMENPVVTPATCSSKGEQYFVCKNENCSAHSETTVLDVAPGVHDYILVEELEATCEGMGREVYRCQYCDDSYSVNVAKIDHLFDKQVTEGAWTYSYCSVCGHTVSSFDASKEDSASINTAGMNSYQAFEVTFKNASVEFPADIANDLKNYSDVAVNAGIVSADVKDSILSSVVSEENKAILEADNSFIYDLGLVVDNQQVHEFYNFVAIKIPYTLAEGEDPEGIVIWYVNGDGETEEITDVAFSDEDGDGVGEVQFEVSHFSFYAVAYRETPEMRCRRGVHDYSNEEIWKKVEATCGFMGYTVKTCCICGFTCLDNFVEAKEHAFGDKIIPEADCDRGLYAYQQCADCGYRKHHEYIPAVGHKIINQASCDMSAVCSVCHKVLIPAYGHNWSDWTVIKEATEAENGLKRRNCPICGEVAEVIIPRKSNIEPWDLDSFEDVIKLLVDTAMGQGNGKLSFKLTQGEEKVECNVLVNVSEESCLAKIEMINVGGEDITVYYKDGELVVTGKVENLEGETSDMFIKTDVDALPTISANFELIYNYLKSILAYYESDISEGIEIAGDLLDEYIEVFGDSLDAQFKENEIDYTAQELKAAFDSMQTLYVYLANKLGVSTVAQIPEGAELPDAEDIENILGIFMEKKESDGNVTYTYDAAKIKTLIEDIINECEAIGEKTLAEIFYDNFGDAIKAHFPELTDWNKLIAHIKKEFGGSVKISTIVDKLLTFIESSEAMTKDELFDMLDEALAKAVGTAFDTEALVKEYGEKTIDQMLAEISGDDQMKVATLYDELNKYMTSTKLNDLVVDTRYEENFDPNNGYMEPTRIDITYKEKIAELKEMLTAINIKGNISITLDGEGNLIDFTLGGAITDGEGNVMSPEIAFDFERTDEKIVIPDNVNKYFEKDVDIEFNDKGDIVISGIPSDAEDVEINLVGGLTTNMADRVVLDKELTKKYGFNVYVLREEYNGSFNGLGEYILGPDGKIYAFTTSGGDYVRVIESMTAYVDFVSNVKSFLPKDGDPYCGIYENGEETVYIYDTVVGKCYLENGVWMIATEINGHQQQDGVTYYHYLEGVEFDSIFASPVISNIQSDYYYYETLEYNGEIFTENLSEIYFESASGNNFAVSALISNGTIYLVKWGESYWSSREYHITEAVDIEYDDISEWYSDNPIYLNGEVVEGYKHVWLYESVPTYYAEYDGYFFRFEGTPFVKIDVSKLEQHTLPDGRILYVVNKDAFVDQNGMIYGYLAVDNGWYVQSACEYKNGVLENIYYRESRDAYYECAKKYHYISADELVDIEKYLTRNQDGTITVSAELVKLIKEHAISYGDSASITVQFAWGDAQFGFGKLITANIPEEFDPELIAPTSGNIEWHYYFGYQSEAGPDYRFDVNVNDDGSITLNTDSGEDIFFEFSFDMDKVDASEIVEYSPILSQQNGFATYTLTRLHKYSSTLAFYKGNYYHTQEILWFNDCKTVTPEQVLKEKWSISDLYYQFDEIDENGVLGNRIYRAEIRWYYMENTSYINNVYVKIIDGEIYVLTGISEESNITLKYEGQVLLSEFIDSLTLHDASWQDDPDYIVGVYGDDYASVRSTNFNIMYGDEYVSGLVMYYVGGEDENKTYIWGGNIWVDVPNLNSSASLHAGWRERNRSSHSFNGMEYELVSGEYELIKTDRYIFVGDTCINLANADIYNKHSMMYNIAISTYVVGVNTDDGWKYYSSWSYGENGIELYDEITIEDDEFVNVEYHLGYTDDEYAIYECRWYDTSSVETYELSNGVMVYAQAGSTYECFAKLADDAYVRGYLVQLEDGSYGFENYWWNDSFSSEDLTEALGLNELISFGEGSATVSREILEKLEKFSEHVSIRIEIDGYYSYRIEYGEFASWFEKE